VADQRASPASDLVARFRAGKVPALARAISVAEDQRSGFEELLDELLQGEPAAKRVGITGPPGAGKSSLLAGVATAYRAWDERVGIVAVDPTSPFSGGALLGDRIRMNELATDPGIFIRSMASRGSLGGLATTTKEVLDLMDAFGFERVLVETVGVGQTELEITAAADTVVVVLVPESGDAIQAMKAGLMEIADIFVVNKADRPGAGRLAKEIRQALHLRAGHGVQEGGGHHGVDLTQVARDARPTSTPAVDSEGWEIPGLETNAVEGTGVEALMDAIERHRAWLEGSGELAARRRDRARGRVRDVVEREMRRSAWGSEAVQSRLDDGVERISRGEGTPYSVARELLSLILR
jgi:LAO/AO transport system kinase